MLVSKTCDTSVGRQSFRYYSSPVVNPDNDVMA